jgi:hypothetical protein
MDPSQALRNEIKLCLFVVPTPEGGGMDMNL